jgi:CHAD domain-containing protein
MADAMAIRRLAAIESAYIVRGEVSPEAIASTLGALMPTRRHPIAHRRFTLFDTFDRRVRQAGASVTASGVNGTSTMAWQAGRGGRLVTARLTHAVGFAWDLPDGPLREALGPVIGVRRLLALADAEEYGTLLEILDDRGKTTARLRIETGRARRTLPNQSWRSLPTVITLCGLRGYEEAYERLVPVILSRPGIEPCEDGFHGVILRQTGVPSRGDVSQPRVDLHQFVRADVGARQIHLALLDLLVANEAGLRANLDTEFLHDFRVALRRTRSLLRQVKEVFPAHEVDHFATEFSWIGRLTGPLRDLDVLLLALRARREEFDDGDLQPLTDLLSRSREEEHARLVAALDSDRYRQLLADWKAFLDRPVSPVPEPPRAALALADVVSHRARRLSGRLAACAIDEGTTAERLHEVRISAKKLRYLIDVTAGFYDPADLKRILTALKKLQRVLGDFNDAQVQERRLVDCERALAGATAAARALRAVGHLVEQARRRRVDLRKEIVEALTRFRARHTRAACRRAFKALAPPEVIQ